MRRGLPLLFLGLVVFACGDDTADEGPTTAGPVCLAFSALKPRNNEELPLGGVCPPPDPAEAPIEGAGGAPEPPPPPSTPVVVLGCDRKLGVEVTTSGWTFRPPFSCGGALGCGYLLVELYSNTPYPIARAESAVSSALLDLTAADPSTLAGYRELRATLMITKEPNERVPFIQCDRTTGFCVSPVSQFVELQLEDCSPDDGAGPDGEAGAGGAGGAGDAGGAGGAGGESNPG
ncbi:MAG TPA: hypothetical protein VGK73_21945 [Polyangiaceae bacterium]